MAIAKSLNINEITTSHFANAPRNDNKISWIASLRFAMTLFTHPLTPAPHLGRGYDTVFSRFTSHFSRKILLTYLPTYFLTFVTNLSFLLPYSPITSLPHKKTELALRLFYIFKNLKPSKYLHEVLQLHHPMSYLPQNHKELQLNQV